MTEKSKQLLAKVRFVEWLSTRHGEMTSVQMAVAIRLVSLYDARRGFAWPSIDKLATDIGANRRTVIRALAHLVEAGLFAKVRGGGRGRASEYAPRFDRVPDGDVYASKTVVGVSPFPVTRDGPETVTSDDETVTSQSLNSGLGVTPSGLGPDLEYIRSLPRASPDGDALRLDDEKQILGHDGKPLPIRSAVDIDGTEYE